MKRLFLAVGSTFVAWMLLDMLIQRVWLAPVYAANDFFFRPSEQMSAALVYAVRFVLVVVFVAAYGLLVRPKSIAAGLGWGALFGLALGTAAGFGVFIYVPIGISLAWGWCIAWWVKGIVAGGIVGVLVREDPAEAGHDDGSG